MGTLHRSADRPPTDVDRVAIGIYPGGTHIGLLYREDGESPTVLLHLCWHRQLRQDDPSAKCHAWVRPRVEVATADTIAAYAALVWEKNQRRGLPYAFSDPRGFFDNNGDIVPGSEQVGLTCSTFVLAIFEVSGVRLLDYNTWPERPDDLAFQRGVIATLDRTGAAKADVAAAAGQLPTARYRPLEVAAGAYADDRPIAFPLAISLADEIGRLIGPAGPPPPAAE
jgi:hypothetical protein